MSGRKRKSPSNEFAAIDDGPSYIRDITAHVELEKAKKQSASPQFRVRYVVNFSKACCSNHKNITRLFVTATKDCFTDGIDPAIIMMN